MFNLAETGHDQSDPEESLDSYQLNLQRLQHYCVNPMANNILKLSNGRKNISISVSNSRITLKEVSFTVAYLKSEVDSVLNVFLELYRRYISTFHITVRSSDCDR